MSFSHVSRSLPLGSVSSSQFTTPTGSINSSTNYDKILASWAKAIELFNSRFTKDEKKKINLNDYKQTQFSDLLNAANAVRDKVEQARYPWTGLLQRILSQINRFAIVGDIIVQHHAEYTSLVWGTFRFLLLFAVEEQKSSEKLSKELNSVAQIVFRAEEYAKLFSTSPESTTDRIFQSLQENLIHLYAEVLNFLVRTTMFFQKSTLRMCQTLGVFRKTEHIGRYASAGFSPDTKFQDILDQINRHEINVEKDKNLLESEARKNQQQYENGLWLQHADFEVDLQKLQKAHIPGTCGWFLRSGVYRKWQEILPTSPAVSFLWVQGKPGSGKSVLASQIVRDVSSLDGAVTPYIFCKGGQEDKNTLESLLRNLVFQLLDKSSKNHFLHELVLRARLSEKTPYVRSMEMLWTLLARMLQENAMIYCILDGLDECKNSKSERNTFITHFTNTFKQNCSRARVIGISQLELAGPADSQSHWEIIQIQSSDVNNDIEKLTSTKIESSRFLRSHPKKTELLERVVTNSDGMILWAELMIQELEAGHWNVERVLDKPPRGLSAMYSMIIDRITRLQTTTDRMQSIFEHVVAAGRPLRLEELALSIAVVEGLQNHSDYDQRGSAAVDGRDLVHECSPLLTIMPDSTVASNRFIKIS